MCCGLLLGERKKIYLFISYIRKVISRTTRENGKKNRSQLAFSTHIKIHFRLLQN